MLEIGAIQHCVYTGPQQADISFKALLYEPFQSVSLSWEPFCGELEKEGAVRRRGFTFGCSGDKTCFVLYRVTE